MRFVLLAAAFLFLSSLAQAKSMVCNDFDIPELKGTTYFNSETPFLQAKLAFFNPDGTTSYKEVFDYIGPNRACNVSLDFAVECTTAEVEDERGYEFYIKCPDYGIKGSFFVDNKGSGRFECESAANSHSYLSYDCVEKEF